MWAWLYRQAWPLPAIVVWAVSWLVYSFGRLWDTQVALVLALLLGLWAAWAAPSRSRRIWVAAGFPVSLLLALLWKEHASGWPLWLWLVPVVLLLLLYPMSAWRDAPLFPTPDGALDDLPSVAVLPPSAVVLDAGCGLGHGLEALRRAYPLARHVGIEKSRVLAALCRWRCRWATVFDEDMWQHGWSAYAMVFVFQRPESMERVWRKALAELVPGAWLVSLDFAVPNTDPYAQIELHDGKIVWVYEIPLLQSAREDSQDE
ncbi:class I SAM-dependent methyltransferase [Curvibacter sp. CHRR-16]|uniref:class I SAM-dependent methyltransferase n=1 Tax=Curvibacter sp. CHRR-16 TaxID=2835872 RepID=UPI001BD99A4B|nr:class I SAM-dependent methyltransferase [Curvibacter sp. CHRR-16]MBT0570257.1 class I SAM-dependent methyltransferase [Curvibacter sp. CHRR-16]